MSLTYSQAVEQTITAGEQIHQIINGTATTEVTVEDGSKVPSVRKALLDNFYFKDPLDWQSGQQEVVFNQLRKFTDGTMWYAPNATASNPINMGATPVGNNNWKVYSLDAIVKLTPQIREAIRRSYAEAGYNMVVGSFEAGGTVATAGQVLLFEAEGKGYSWNGTLPKIVSAGSTPAGSGGIGSNEWIDRSEWLGVNSVSVKDPMFAGGAKGDGVSNDTVPMQAAMAYIASHGGTLYIPAGNYQIANSLFITSAAKPFAIVGDGSGSTILTRSANSSTVLTIGISNYWRISGLSINANFALYPTNASHGLSFYNSSFVSIEDVEVYDWKNTGIIGYSSPAGPSNNGNVVLVNCRVDGKNNSNNGILLADYNDSGYINCHAVNIGKTGSPCYALQFKESSRRCYMIGGTAHGGRIGIACGNTLENGNLNEENRFIGVRIESCNAGIAFGASRRHLVDSCVIDMKSAGNHALDFQRGSSECTVRNLQVLNLAVAKSAANFREGDTNNTVEISSISNSSGVAEKAAIFEVGSSGNLVELGLYAKPTVTFNTNLVSNHAADPTNVFKYGRVPFIQSSALVAGVFTLRDYGIQYIRVDTEGAAPTDDLDTILNGGERQTITLQSSNNTRDTTVKHGTGNIALAGGADFILSNTQSTLVLMYNSTISKWCEISRSAN